MSEQLMEFVEKMNKMEKENVSYTIVEEFSFGCV